MNVCSEHMDHPVWLSLLHVSLFVWSIHHYQTSVTALRAQSLVIDSPVTDGGCDKIRNICMRWLTVLSCIFSVCAYSCKLSLCDLALNPWNSSSSLLWAIPRVCSLQSLSFYRIFIWVHFSHRAPIWLLPALLSGNDLKVLSIKTKSIPPDACTAAFDWKYWSWCYCCWIML